VDPLTGLMTPQALAQARDRHGPVRAVLPVHLGGRLCDLEGLSAVMTGTGAVLIEDAAHAVGGLDQDGAPVGACRRSLAAIFSFHPVKTLTSGEGGMVTLNDQDRARRMRRLRNHGVTHDPALMTEPGSFDADGVLNPWSYEQCELGFNYRMNELEAALGLSQLAKLERFIAKRIALADRYDIRLAELGPLVRPAARGAGRPGLHLFVVMIDFAALGRSRARVMTTLRSQGVGTQVHYIPLYRQPYFKRRYGEMRLPGAEAYYDRALALPLHPSMGETDVDRVVDALKSALFGP
jgi:dTDP-4-amino-4,6-dideoxygalactose transaminase